MRRKKWITKNSLLLSILAVSIISLLRAASVKTTCTAKYTRISKALAKIKEMQPQGIIFTGGPASVYEDNAPKIEEEVFALGYPCPRPVLRHAVYGSDPGRRRCSLRTMREFGKTPVTVNTSSPLFKGLQEKEIVWMSHTLTMYRTFPKALKSSPIRITAL